MTYLRHSLEVESYPFAEMQLVIYISIPFLSTISNILVHKHPHTLIDVTERIVL